jgi:heme exporter protein B
MIRTAWLIAKKDLVVETRSRELVLTTIFFALSVIVVFSFAFVRDGQVLGEPGDAAAGILWVSLAFSGTLALGRAFERERQAETLRALLLAPCERAAVYVGKLIGLLGVLVAVEMLMVPLVAVLFDLPLLRGTTAGYLVALLATGTIGFAAVGTLFAAMLVRAHSRDVLLPVLLYPMTVPVIIAGVLGTAAVFAPEMDLGRAQTCLGMLVFFDAVFVTLALWTFGPVMSE